MNNEVAIITGGTSGIGEGIATKLHKEGARLIINGRDTRKGQALQEALSPGTHFVAGDVKQAETNQLLVEEALKRFGQLDMLVLSAGQLGIGRLDALSIEDWQATIATNLHAVFYLLRYALPVMEKTGGGSIAIIGSVAAFHAFPNHPAYTASKGALVPLVRQIALDYGPSIRINLICPAQVQTPLLDRSVAAFANPEDILEETSQRLPLKRLGTPEDIANAVIFLLSDQASWVTGSHFVIDGGFLAT